MSSLYDFSKRGAVAGPDRDVCLFEELPDDMHQLLWDILGEAGFDESRLAGHSFKVEIIPISDFPPVTLDESDRGEEHVASMIGAQLPPVVRVGSKWIDGRHRFAAGTRMKGRFVPTINLEEVGMQPSKVISPYLGEIMFLA